MNYREDVDLKEILHDEFVVLFEQHSSLCSYVNNIAVFPHSFSVQHHRMCFDFLLILTALHRQRLLAIMNVLVYVYYKAIPPGHCYTKLMSVQMVV